MAKIPIILEAGRADGKLIKTNSVYDDNQEKFLSDKIKEIDDNHNTLKDNVNIVTNIINNNKSDIENKLEKEQTRATNAESILNTNLNAETNRAITTEDNLKETINNITNINEHAATAELITVNTLPNSTVSNVQQALDDLYKNVIYDISELNGGVVFESLQALLNDFDLNTLIPTSVRHGGMTIRFIQGSEQSSDNKYIQARCMAQNFTTNATQWQEVDDVPTAGSENLVKSGGVSRAITNAICELSRTDGEIIGEKINGSKTNTSISRWTLNITLEKDKKYLVILQTKDVVGDSAFVGAYDMITSTELCAISPQQWNVGFPFVITPSADIELGVRTFTNNASSVTVNYTIYSLDPSISIDDIKKTIESIIGYSVFASGTKNYTNSSWVDLGVTLLANKRYKIYVKCAQASSTTPYGLRDKSTQQVIVPLTSEEWQNGKTVFYETGNSDVVLQVRCGSSSITYAVYYNIEVPATTYKSLSEIYSELQGVESSFSKHFNTLDLEISDLKIDVNELYDTEYSIGTWVFKHIKTDGTIINNDNKNIVFESPVSALKNSRISVDEGYKYQLGLYDFDTGNFIERVTWMFHDTVYILDNNYKIRIELSNSEETPLVDTSIQEHLHYELIASKTPDTEVVNNRADKIIKDTDDIVIQTSALVNAIGIDNFLNKKITVTSPYRYSSWPFVAVCDDRLICLYSVGAAHQDYETAKVYAKTSLDGVLWSTEKLVCEVSGLSINAMGKGNIGNGNVIFWNRVGTASSPVRFELWETDGTIFRKCSTYINNSEGVTIGHIGDIISVETVGLVAFFNTYGYDSRSWGMLTSSDDGLTWTATVVESNITPHLCPTEISPAYLGNGKIIAMGRLDVKSTEEGAVNNMYQMESSDYGATWTKSSTNIDDVNSSTPSIVYDSVSDKLNLYYVKRGAPNASLRIRETTPVTVFGHPDSWPTIYKYLYFYSEHGYDGGNVNAVRFGSIDCAAFYGGGSDATGIYGYLNKE